MTIVIYYLAYYVAARLCEGDISKVMAAMWLFTVFYIVLFKALGFRDWWYQSVLAFNVGMLFAHRQEPVLQTMHTHTKTSLFVLMASMLCTVLILEHSDPGHKVFVFMLMSMVIGILAFCLTCCRPISSNKVLQHLGNMSYEIYLVHGAIVSMVFGMAYTYISRWWWAMTILTLCATIFFATILRGMITVINRKVITT